MLRFNALIFISTNLCNLRCRHCYTSSGPSREQMFRFGPEKMMAPGQAERYIRQLPGLPGVGKRIHFGGGEPTLFFKELKEILKMGKEHGLPGGVTTNCSWAKNQDKADQCLEELHACGLRRLEISLSIFHQEFLDIECALYAIRAAKKYGLEIILRPIITRQGSVAETLKNIPEEDLKNVSISLSKCLPVGRARAEMPAEEFLYEDIEAMGYTGCQKILNLTIRPDGAVYPCCAGSDVTTALCLGNADKEPLSEILARAELDPLLTVLTTHGSRYLAELLREAGGKDFLKDPHVGICHLCNDLFINDAVAGEVREALHRKLRSNKVNENVSKAEFLFSDGEKGF